MNKKYVKNFLTSLGTALACMSACAAVFIGNPAEGTSNSNGTDGTEIIQNAEKTGNREEKPEPGISPQSNEDDEVPLIEIEN